MKIFLDTEFSGLHRNASLISIGLAAENGNLFYGELRGYDGEQIDPWVREHVFPALSGNLADAATLPASDTMRCIYYITNRQDAIFL